MKFHDIRSYYSHLRSWSSDLLTTEFGLLNSIQTEFSVL